MKLPNRVWPLAAAGFVLILGGLGFAQPPEGFTPLFNGKDLTGWKGLVATPVKRREMSKEELAAAQEKADQNMREHWKVVDGALEFDGKGQSLVSAKDYGDFELYVDWKILEGGDSGIYVRGTPQIQIWDTEFEKYWPLGADKGSGGLWNNQKNPRHPLVKADNPVGQWNTFFIRMEGERVTVKLNGKLVVDNVVLENYWERDKPVYPRGSIELQNHGNTLWFRNIYIRELNKTAQADGDDDVLFSIESTRGGRHWVGDKTAPPKSADESQACFQIEPGWEVKLVASEPLVVDPVGVCFDEQGRMFAVEYGDYPLGSKDGKPLSRVVYIEDTDGDGAMDRRHVFADKLTFAHSLTAWKGGILVGAKTKIIFLKDTDKDHKADVREVLFEGFKDAHPQMQIGCPRWGLDNWIYWTYGNGEVVAHQSRVKKTSIPRVDFRFHPLSMEYGPVTGRGQYGNTFDNWGHRYYSSNRNPVMTSMLSQEAVARNPFVVIPTAHTDVAPSGGDTRVYPLVEMKSNWLAHAGTHTAACGVTAYQGDHLTAKDQTSVFVCEPIGHLVTRTIVRPDGVGLKGVRARPKADFLASTDTWFRPASLANGPDGALYLCDMYRLHVEHPKFLPEDVAAKLDWRAGDDRGRIWRLIPKGAKVRPFQAPQSTQDCVAMLSDPNGWRRYLGQRLLVERQDVAAAKPVRDLMYKSRDPRTRLHALWTLDGLGELQNTELERALQDANVYVRRDAVKLAAPRLKSHRVLFRLLREMVDDPEAKVRFQVALASGLTDDPEATAWLIRLAKRDGADQWMAAAILSACEKRSGAVLAGLIKEPEFAANGSPANIDLIRRLAVVVGARGEIDELETALDAITAGDETGTWWQAASLTGLATGLTRHRGDLGRTSLAKLTASPPPQIATSLDKVKELLDHNAQIALDSKRSTPDRVAAVGLLALKPFDQAADDFEKLLSTTQPLKVQLASIQAMRSAGSPKAAQLVLERWPSLGPTVRPPALELLFRRTDSIKLALRAMDQGKISASAVGLDQRVRLLRRKEKDIQSLAKKLFGGAVSANRRAVAVKYRPAAGSHGDPTAGAKVFQKVCAQCHRIDGFGHEVGPDISDVRNRSKDALLFDILDPNSKVEPRYTDYMVLTDDGQILNGLVVSESPEAVVLRQAEGKQRVISRAEIEQIKASGKSLMPEGVEKDVSVEQMADLLAFLKARSRPKLAKAEVAGQ